jgi:hypothetical protein
MIDVYKRVQRFMDLWLGWQHSDQGKPLGNPFTLTETMIREDGADALNEAMRMSSGTSNPFGVCLP